MWKMAKKGQAACPKIFKALAVDLCPRWFGGKPKTPDSEEFQVIPTNSNHFGVTILAVPCPIG